MGLTELEERTAREIVDGAYRVHRALGPGLLETVYETCLKRELETKGIGYRSQMVVPIRYDEYLIDSAFRLDLLVEDRVIVELKSVQRLEPVFTAQLLTYLKLSGLRLGLLINFNVPLIRDGIHRLIL